MHSNDICRRLGRPSDGWRNLADGLGKCSQQPMGIYVYRTADEKPFGRYRGESDIVYIGCGNIAIRVKQHGSVRPDVKDKGWLLALLGRERQLQVGFFPCAEPKSIESGLLNDYFNAHLELPPVSRRLESTNISKAALFLTATFGENARSVVQRINANVSAAGSAKSR